jgi:hypothetical protein
LDDPSKVTIVYMDLCCFMVGFYVCCIMQHSCVTWSLKVCGVKNLNESANRRATK